MAKSTRHEHNKYREAILRQLNRVTAEILIVRYAYLSLVQEEAAFSAALLEQWQSRAAAVERFSSFQQRSRSLLRQLKECEKRKHVLEGALKVLDGEPL